MMKDQYGNPVPGDLIVLTGETPGDFTDFALKLIDDADWYEVNGFLLVSSKAVQHCFDGDPIDAGLDLRKAKVLYVASCLHRWDDELFYHA
jgi:hypothetical protein